MFVQNFKKIGLPSEEIENGAKTDFFFVYVYVRVRTPNRTSARINGLS